MKMLAAKLLQPEIMFYGMMIFSLLRGAPVYGAEQKDFYDFTLTSIEGKPLNLGDFKGRVVLLVNTASQCGFTPQYSGLQALYDEFKDRGLVVLGVPSNDFMGQEPGDNSQIKKFCEVNFNINFPMTEKSKVLGADALPLFRWLATEPKGGKPKWNFHKYLIGRDGRLRENFSSFTKPDAEKLRTAVITALGENS
jgi:glutathione peroxidase